MKLISLGSILFSASLAGAQAPAAPAPIPVPKFIAHTVDGPLPAASLSQFSDDLSVRTGGDAAKVVPAGGLVSLNDATKPRPELLDRNVLLLSNGDRVPLDVKAAWRLQDYRFYFRPAAPVGATVELSLSVNRLCALVLGDAETPVESELFLARLIDEARTLDVVWLTNGDRLEGKLRSLNNSQGAILTVNGQDTPVPLSRIGAVAFNTEFKAKPRVKGPYAHVVLAGGTRLGMAQLRLDADKSVLLGKTLFGAAVEFPLSKVRAIDVRNGPAVYLSDLPVQSYQHTPFLTVAWPMTKDTSVVGRPIRLGPDVFDKGLGMHTQSRVAYKLEGKYRWFEAIVGLDERTGRMGKSRVKVLVDGKEQDLKAEATRSWKDGPLKIRVDVNKAQELTLVAEFADLGDVQGHVNWADARPLK